MKSWLPGLAASNETQNIKALGGNTWGWLKALGAFSLRYLRGVFSGLPSLIKLLIVFMIVNTVLAAGIVGTQIVVLQNTAEVKTINLGIYWDFDCSSVVEAIDWGKIEPGEEKVIDVYIRNEGNTDFALSVQAVNWHSPEAVDYVTFDCDYQGQIVKTLAVVHARLILYVSPSVEGITDFSFDVAIEAAG